MKSLEEDKSINQSNWFITYKLRRCIEIFVQLPIYRRQCFMRTVQIRSLVLSEQTCIAKKLTVFIESKIHYDIMKIGQEGRIKDYELPATGIGEQKTVEQNTTVTTTKLDRMNLTDEDAYRKNRHDKNCSDTVVHD
ncbi:hypothetical protein DICVIV_01756 [Dictyocaulus viviparus]|uniref:Uncharacterized protein n=1 Tax=Dictyocaulus viviparus TaxID=29172 RepID=A0A0D8Y5N7_DICVI|nr:hypothetical protein DICVIV_01756 [Dictyocaulus viviparus]